MQDAVDAGNFDLVDDHLQEVSTESCPAGDGVYCNAITHGRCSESYFLCDDGKRSRTFGAPNGTLCLSQSPGTTLAAIVHDSHPQCTDKSLSATSVLGHIYRDGETATDRVQPAGGTIGSVCAAAAAFTAVEHAYGLHAGWLTSAAGSTADSTAASIAVDSQAARLLLRAIAQRRESGVSNPGDVLQPDASALRSELGVPEASAQHVRDMMPDQTAATLQCVWSTNDIARRWPAKRRAAVDGSATAGILGVDQSTFVDRTRSSQGEAALARSYQCTTHYMTCVRQTAQDSWWPRNGHTTSSGPAALSPMSTYRGTLQSRSSWSTGAAEDWQPLAI